MTKSLEDVNGIIMGKGFAILIWDGYGSGLVRINPRLLAVGVDIYGNPKNWWSYENEEDRDSKVQELISGMEYYQIIED